MNRGIRPRQETDRNAVPTEEGQKRTIEPELHDESLGLKDFTVVDVLGAFSQQLLMQDLIVERSTYRGAYSNPKAVNLLEAYSKLKETCGSEWKEGQGRDALIEQAEQKQGEGTSGDTPSESSQPPKQDKTTPERIEQDLDTIYKEDWAAKAKPPKKGHKIVGPTCRGT